jgi:hypothetical protein
LGGPHASHMQATCKPHASHMQDTRKPHASHMQATCKPHARHTQVTCAHPHRFSPAALCVPAHRYSSRTAWLASFTGHIDPVARAVAAKLLALAAAGLGLAAAEQQLQALQAAFAGSGGSGKSPAGRYEEVEGAVLAAGGRGCCWRCVCCVLCAVCWSTYTVCVYTYGRKTAGLLAVRATCAASEAMHAAGALSASASAVPCCWTSATFSSTLCELKPT